MPRGLARPKIVRDLIRGFPRISSCRSVNIRRVFVDDSTTPVTFWIGSNHGASLIALQALDEK